MSEIFKDFARNASTAEVETLMAMLEKKPDGASLTCKCGYKATKGATMLDLMMDLGMHAVIHHQDARDAIDQRRKEEGLPKLNWPVALELARLRWVLS